MILITYRDNGSDYYRGDCERQWDSYLRIESFGFINNIVDKITMSITGGHNHKFIIIQSMAALESIATCCEVETNSLPYSIIVPGEFDDQYKDLEDEIRNLVSNKIKEIKAQEKQKEQQIKQEQKEKQDKILEQQERALLEKLKAKYDPPNSI